MAAAAQVKQNGFCFIAFCRGSVEGKAQLGCTLAYHHLTYILLAYFAENRAGPSNLGNVISQILLCKQFTPDFNEEELCSITKDSQDIAMLLSEMQEYMPQHEAYLGEFLECAGSRSHCRRRSLQSHCRALWYLAKARWKNRKV